MAIHVIQTTFFLSFLATAVSVAGLFMGLKGAFEYIRVQRAKTEEKKDDEGKKEEEEKEEKFKDWYK